MSNLPQWMAVLGLTLDVIGFGLLSSLFLKPQDEWPYLGGGSSVFKKNVWGFWLVIYGFLLQGAAQLKEIFPIPAA